MSQQATPKIAVGAPPSAEEPVVVRGKHIEKQRFTRVEVRWAVVFGLRQIPKTQFLLTYQQQRIIERAILTYLDEVYGKSKTQRRKEAKARRTRAREKI